MEGASLLPPLTMEGVKGNYKEFWSVRINDQWRIIFKWQGEDSFDVAILDYH